MRCKNRKNVAPVVKTLARLDKKGANPMSFPILAENDNSSGGRKPRPPVELSIHRESTSRPGVTVDIRLGRWWFDFFWVFWFDISRERGGDVVPVFPRWRGDE